MHVWPFNYNYYLGNLDTMLYKYANFRNGLTMLKHKIIDSKKLLWFTVLNSFYFNSKLFVI